jgi:4'-phosphopantetheinyl transferase
LELWCVDLEAAGRALREMERLTMRLSSADRERAAALPDTTATEEWLAAHAALRVLLERTVGARWREVPFARAAHGKPHLDGASVSFSISHVPGLALIGIASRGTIGVDVERVRTVRVRAPRRRPIEAAEAALDPQPLPGDEDARFLQAWVRLEAFAKADGRGIGRLLTRLGIVGGGGAESETVPAQVDRLRAELGIETRDLRLGDGLFAAVALAPPQPVPDVSWLPASIDGLDKLLA